MSSIQNFLDEINRKYAASENSLEIKLSKT